jgi:hypothetical protein
VAVEIFCHDTTELNALLAQFPEDDETGLPREFIHRPDVKEVMYGFATMWCACVRRMAGSCLATRWKRPQTPCGLASTLTRITLKLSR